MKKILILCPYPEGRAAGQRLKYEQYFDDWIQEGYEITVSSFFSNETWNILFLKGHLIPKVLGTISGYLRRLRDLFFLKDYELVYIFLWVTPLGPPIFERIIRFLCRKVIFDFDDSIFLDLKQRRFIDIFQDYRDNKKLMGNSKPNFLIQTSNHVILSSPFSLAYCKKKNIFNNATYIPCTLDTKRFELKKNFENAVPVIGWTGTYSSIPYLESIKDVFYTLKELRDFKFTLITNFSYELPGINIEVIRWNKESEIRDLHKIDIGIYPLIEDKWTLGKGGLKLLQYMAIGVPAVATNYGTACNIISSGENGFLVKNKDEWVESLCLLIDNEKLRVEMGKKAREKILKEYSTDRNKIKYLNILNSL